MRTFKTNLLGLALAGLILGACSQTATYETADLMNEQASAKAGFNLSPFGMGGENLAISDAPCIDATSGAAFAQTFTGNYNSNFSASIKVYNTLTHIIYEFGGTYDCIKLTDFNGSEITLEGNQYKVPLSNWKHGDQKAQNFWVGRNGCSGQGSGQAVIIPTSYNLIGICTETTLSAGTEAAICEGDSFTLTASVAADGNFTGGTIEILADGNPIPVATAAVTAENKFVTYSGPWTTAGSYSFSARYVPSNTNGYKASVGGPSVVEVKKCDDCDDTSFKYQTEDGLDITFFYNSTSPLTNAEIKFTFPQIKNISVNGSYTAPDGKVYSVNNNGNNTVLTWKGDISCQEGETSFRFIVEADCNASGKAQIWTSASVNGEEVKNEGTPNIVVDCN